MPPSAWSKLHSSVCIFSAFPPPLAPASRALPAFSAECHSPLRQTLRQAMQSLRIVWLQPWMICCASASDIMAISESQLLVKDQASSCINQQIHVSMWSLLLFVLAPFVAADAELEYMMQKLTACWMLSVKEVSANQPSLNSLIQIQSVQGNTNRTAVFYRIQVDMVYSCYEEIEDEQTASILNSVTEAQPSSVTYRDIVKDFNYDDYKSPEFDWEFDKDTQRMVRFFKDFESWVADHGDKASKAKVPQQAPQNQTKQSVLHDLKMKLTKLAQEKSISEPNPSTAKQDDEGFKERYERAKFIVERKASMNSPTNYVLALIIIPSIAGAFIFFYRALKKMQAPQGKKKDKKQQ